MSRYRFALATEEDDDALRHRMTQDIMEGPISVSFRREPGYFAGSLLQGAQTQVITCTDQLSNTIVGIGTRATLPTYINGSVARTGYLCDLRGDASARGGLLLARGYRYLKQLHEADPLPLYYTMILDGNEKALELLGSGRANLPCYRAMGRVNTPAILFGRKRKFKSDPSLHLGTPQPADMEAVLSFVNRCNQRYQFAPVFDLGDFNNGRLAGLSCEDFTVAWCGNKITGVTACWDQRATRQIHIEKYSAALRVARPLYNRLANIIAYKPLPSVGQSLACVYLSMVAIENDDATVFSNLLEHIYASRRNGPWQMCFAGLHEDHPLNRVLDGFRQIKAAGQLFAVHWPEDQYAFDQLDRRIPHVEAGAL